MLHGSTLSQYWRNKRIPRGLRINKVPTLGCNNPAFCKKWCEVLNKCSLDLILLVVEYTLDELSKTRTEISDLQGELQTKFSSQQMSALNERCTSFIDAHKKELSENKLKKYRCDTLDYKNDRVYPWLHTEAQRL
ncbi:hypothetical protein ABVT39_020564 [Epinephelus coioides]